MSLLSTCLISYLPGYTYTVAGVTPSSNRGFSILARVPKPNTRVPGFVGPDSRSLKPHYRVIVAGPGTRYIALDLCDLKYPGPTINLSYQCSRTHGAGLGPIMSDPSALNNPLHPDIAPYLDSEYAAFHNKYLINQPAIHKIPWNPACRVGSNPGELEPCKVGSVRDLTVPGSPPVNVRIFTPPGERPTDGWPVLVYFHGGGWMLGNIDAENSFMTRTCLTAKCVVVAVDYRLAPEHIFPAAVDDCWTTLEWIYGHGSVDLEINPSKIAVGGSSSGGNLGAVMTQRAVQRVPPLPITYQVLIVPVTDNTVQEDGSSLLPTHHESWVKWKNTTPLIPREMLWFRSYYLPDKSHWTHVDASPLLQKDAQVWDNLPNAWIAVAELDILRSEGEGYAQRLKEAGKDVKLVVYPGAPHSIIIMDKVVRMAFQLGEDAAEALYQAFYGPWNISQAGV